MNDNIIKSIREALQVSQSQFSERFNIPVKTVQSWESGIRKPPAYVPEMMLRICELESELEVIKNEYAAFKENTIFFNEF